MLRPIDEGEVDLVSGWLNEARNSRWLDFGGGRQSLDPVALHLMVQRDIHHIRIYTTEEDLPIGVIGLSDINRVFRTATIWAVLGRKDYGVRDLTVRAGREILDYGFSDLDLVAVNAWTVETNRHGKRLLERIGFKPFGRQRSCHWIDGHPYDRLWYDLLAREHIRSAP